MEVSGKFLAVVLALLFLAVSIPILVMFRDRSVSFIKSGDVAYCEETGVDQAQFTQNLVNLYLKDTKNPKRAYTYYSYS
ncbi:hypothetical protein KY321_03075, partial [Candidatus Woesearchaeota archaeon]|nr:hypothetical protein [Candidatus Woesearchaeota archaeon]